MRRLLGLTMVLLAVQVVLSTVVKLYVTIPPGHPGASGNGYFGQSQRSLSWALAHGGPWLQAHTGLGLILVLLALIILAVAIVTLRGGLFFTALLGLIGVVAGGAFAAAWLDFDQNLWLLLMTIGIAVALAAYTLALLVTPSSRSRY